MTDVFAGVRTRKQLKCVLADNRIGAVILQAGCFSDTTEFFGCGKTLYFALPAVARENKRQQLEDMISNILTADAQCQAGFLIENMDEAALLKSAGFTGPIIAGEFCYAYNSAAVSFYRNLFPSMEFLAPAELSLKELEKIEKETGIRFICKAYGHQRLMATAQCLYKEQKGCLKEGGRKNDSMQDCRGGIIRKNDRDGNPFMLAFADRKQERFYAVPDCAFCMNTIFNGKPTFMLDKKAELAGKPILLDFTIESADEVKNILRVFRRETVQAPTADRFTRGHYYKKID